MSTSLLGTADRRPHGCRTLSGARSPLTSLHVRCARRVGSVEEQASLVIKRQGPKTAVLLLSQYVEERYAADPPSANTSGIGYLLKQRVADVEEYADCLRRVAAGGTAPDPQVISQLLARRHSDPLDRLTPRERETLELMAGGRSA